MFADIVIRSGDWGISNMLIAAVAIFLAYCQYAGVQVPPIFVKCFWIVIAAAVAIFAIRFLFSL